MNRLQKLNNSTMTTIKSALNSKGIKFDSKSKKSDLQALVTSNSKSFEMGNRTGNYVFGSKRNTHAGNVCMLIAKGIVKSKSDIRKHYTKKYSFKQTLERLAFERIIEFKDKSHSTFELTEKGIAIGSKQAQIFG